MAVIINDFEVIVETPANSAEGGAPGAPKQESPPTTLRPEELARIERHYRERRRRLTAD